MYEIEVEHDDGATTRFFWNGGRVLGMYGAGGSWIFGFFSEEKARKIWEDEPFISWGKLNFTPDIEREVEVFLSGTLSGKSDAECAEIYQKWDIEIYNQMWEHMERMEEEIDEKLKKQKLVEEKLEIMFGDLTPQAQDKLLDFYGVDYPEQMNWDIHPIFILLNER